MNTPENPPKKNASTPVWDLVIADMTERDQIGRQKYGTPLQAGNGRDPLVDAYQEALDLVVYLRQAICEREISCENGTELPRAKTIHERFTISASGAPALVVCLQLEQDQADTLVNWYNQRQKELKTEKWKSWGPAEIAIRTLCAQIEHYGPVAFRRAPTLFDESLPDFNG